MELKNTEEITREVMKNESLEKEIARYRISQGELEEKVKEQRLLLTSKQLTVNNSSILEKASLLDLELLDSKCEQMDLKDECYTDGQELSNIHEGLLNDQNENSQTLKDLKSKLKSSVEECVKLKAMNEELEATVERLQLELDARDARMKELDEQLTIFDEELVSKDITIGKLMMKRAKRRGLRGFICCWSYMN